MSEINRDHRKCDVCGQIGPQPGVQQIARSGKDGLHRSFRCFKCIQEFEDSPKRQPPSTLHWREESLE